MTIKLSEHFTYKKLIRFTFPTIIMMIFSSIYGVVDGLFVSNIVGSEAMAAINLIFPAVMIFGAIGFMFGTGGSAMVSKTLGEGKKEKANEYFSMLIYLIVIVGVVVSVIGFIYTRPIAILLGAKGDMIRDCVVYGRVMFISLTAFMLQNSFQSFFIVAEKPQLGLKVSIAAGITNMILDFLFIYVLRMGIIGAAIGTGISQVVGGVIPIFYFLRNNSSNLKLLKAGFEWNIIWKSSMNGASEMVTNISMSLVAMLYNLQLMKIAGSNGVVAYSVIMYTGFIFVGIHMGYSIGCAPIVGFHYGAGNKKEMSSLLQKSMKLILVTSIVLTIAAELTAGLLAGIFVGYHKELMHMTENAIRIYSLSYLISGMNIFASSFFTALNNGYISALISFLRTLVFQIAMIMILPLLFDINGVWFASIVAEFLALFISMLCILMNRKRYGYHMIGSHM